MLIEDLRHQPARISEHNGTNCRPGQQTTAILRKVTLSRSTTRSPSRLRQHLRRPLEVPGPVQRHDDDP